MTMLLEGVDISHWQSGLPPMVGRHLAVVKISQSDYVDPGAADHLAALHRLGYGDGVGAEYVGGYHWLDPEPPAAAQAAVYLRNVPAWVDFHAVDVEGRLLTLGTRYSVARDMAATWIDWIHARDHRPVLQYSSRGTWPGSNGQDGNWVADYTGDPNRLVLRLTARGVPWVVWQYSSSGGRLDLDRFDPDVLGRLCGRTSKPPVPAPAQGGPAKVKFIQVSAADTKLLESIDLPANTAIETLDGEQWTTLGPTKVHAYPGLPDGHSDRRVVVVSTGRFYADKLRRYTAQVAVIPS